MKANWKLFTGLSIFYVAMAVIYYAVGGEAVGITGMILAACLAGMVGFYLWFTQKRIGFDIPSDNLEAEIADDAVTTAAIADDVALGGALRITYTYITS